MVSSSSVFRNISQGLCVRRRRESVCEGGSVCVWGDVCVGGECVCRRGGGGGRSRITSCEKLDKLHSPN